MFKRLLTCLLAALALLSAAPLRAHAMAERPEFELLLDPVLDTGELFHFVDGIAIAHSRGVGYRLIGTDGKFITEKAYDLIRPESNRLFVVSEGGKFGAVNRRGEVMVTPAYDALTDFLDGYAIAVKDGKSQVINLLGEIGEPIELKKIELLPGGLLKYETDGYWTLADIRGNVLSEYRSIRDFSEGRAVVTRDGYSGVIDTAGKEIVPLVYDYIDDYRDGVTIVHTGGLLGLAGLDGNLLIKAKYRQIGAFEDRMAPVALNGKYGVIDITGQELIAPKYDDLMYFGNKLWYVKSGSKWALAGSANQTVTDFRYDTVSRLFSGFAQVRANDRLGCLNSEGIEIAAPAYDFVFPGEREVILQAGDIYTVMDQHGTVIAGPCKSASALSDGLRAVMDLDGRWGYVDASGQTVIPFQYAYASQFRDGYAVAGKSVADEKLAVIDRTGAEVSPSGAMPLENLGNGLFLTASGTAAGQLSDGAGYGVMNTRGELAVPCEYLQIVYDPEGNTDFIALIRSQSGLPTRFGIMDGTGAVRLPAEYQSIIRCEQLTAEQVPEEGPSVDMTATEAVASGVSFSGLYWVQRDGKWGLVRMTPRAHIPTAWAAEHVERAFEAGLVPDWLMSDFSSPATRLEFCELAAGLYEKITGVEIPVRTQFIDTNNISVEKMGGLDVVAGVGDGRFAPDRPLTREQASVILSKLMTALDLPVASAQAAYSDMGEVSDWARTSVGKMQQSGIMGGTGNNLFSPAAFYTREQCITTLLKVYDLATK